MYKDIITYKLAQGITEAHLLTVASEIIESWMNKQKGFINWEVHNTSEEGTYTDIVTWESKESAKAAEAKMMQVPNGMAWFACYEKGSIKSKNLVRVGEFK